MVVNGNKETVLVAGHKRLKAARALGLEEIIAIRIEEPLRSPDLFLMSVVSNWKQNLSDIDRAFALKRAVSEFGLNDEDLKFALCPALGIAFDRHTIDQSVKNFNLVPEILNRIAAGDLPFRGSQILLQMTDEDQKEFARIAESIHLTTNQVLKLGEWIADLTTSSKTNLHGFAAAHPIEAILNHPGWDKKTKGEKLFAKVRELRLPRIMEHEKKFRSLAKSVEQVFPAMKIHEPEFFEDEGVRLDAHLRNPEMLDQMIRHLQENRPRLNSLFDFML